MQTLADPTVIDQMTPIPFRVRSVREELSHTFTLELEPPDGDFRFLPGQFTMVYAFGIGEVPISRTRRSFVRWGWLLIPMRWSV